MSVSPLIFTLGGFFLLILVAGALSFWGFLNVFILKDDVNERLTTYTVVSDEIQRKAPSFRSVNLSRWRIQLNNMLSILTSQELSFQLISANWPISPTEFILIRIGGTLACFFLGWFIIGSPLSGIGLAVLGYLAPSIHLKRSLSQRRLAFERQLIDILVLLTGSARAGYSLQQAFDVVVKEMRPPASDEFRRVLREVGLGLPLNQALINLTERMDNDDLKLMVTAININTKVGGNLVNMLDAVTNTIRERIRLFSELRTITAQQRYSAYLLTLLPFGIGALLFILNPVYMSKLFEPGIFLCIPAGALVFMILGNIIIRRMLKIKV
jgi:tight adherence protein B